MVRCLCRLAILLGFAALLAPASAQLVRSANTTLKMPANPPTTGYTTQAAFGSLTFAKPTGMTTPPGETDRLFVWEKAGLLRVITNLSGSSASTFLDLRSKISGGTEDGLLGVAFHPNYASNGFFYVFYTTSGTAHNDRLSRFKVSSSNRNVADPNSEMVLIDQLDEAQNHNAGDLHFGPDGYLYVSLGDEGGGNGIWNNDQRIDKDFFSAILRIDVDNKSANKLPNSHASVKAGTYRVPADNPFIGATSFNGSAVTASKVRTEFWAVGFRNPWRFSFDPSTGKLYVGDVGQSAREEVDVVTKGGNYGWAFREGKIAGPKAKPAGATAIDPIWDYPRTEGQAITGGLVYRGQNISALYGAYIFADYLSGNLWSLRQSGSSTTVTKLLTDPGLVAFGTDPRNGDILAADIQEGRLKRLVVSTTSHPLPATLTATGAFSNLSNLTPNAGIVGYQPNVSFWSDYAVKTRWFSIPSTANDMTFRTDSNWTFPTGSVWIKHFELELTRGNPATKRRLETRFLVKTSSGIYGATYRWNSAGTEANLVAEGGQDENITINDGGTNITQKWHYPSRSECQACHTSVGGYALSFNTRQLNRNATYGGTTLNQIQALSDAGYFTAAVGTTAALPKVAAATDTAFSEAFRARSYLSVNCSQCHQPGGPGLGSWDARISTALASAGIINGTLGDNGGNAANRVIVPNDTAHSMIHRRISGASNAPRMPPIGSNVLDTAGAALIASWINDGAPNPPEQAVSTDPANGTYRVIGVQSGKGLDVTAALTTDNALIDQYTYTGGQNQRWQITAVSGGYYKIIAAHSGKALTVPGSSMENSVQTVQLTYAGTDNQLWKFDVVAGNQRIVAKHSGKALDVKGQSLENGAPINQYTAGSGANQQWILSAP